MPDTTFETVFSDQLRAYAEGGVRPIDRYAIAEATIAAGRRRRGWIAAALRGERRVLFPILVGLLLAALAGGATLIAGRLFAPQHRTYLGAFVAAPDLSMTMADPVVVPLLDGRVLVIGDDGDGGGRGSRALIYDPETGLSEATDPMVSADTIWVESAVLLQDGRVLVFWCDCYQVANGFAQVFDPATGRFSPAGPMVTPRSMAAAAVLPDGRVLVTGGYPPGADGATSSAELFDPATSMFSATASMTTSRAGHTMATLPDGRVFVSPGASRYTVELFDPTTGTFSAAGEMASWSFGLAMALPDGRVIVLGGSSLGDHGAAAIWDPATQTFGPERELPGWVRRATLLDDGRILLIGGRANWSAVVDVAAGETKRIQPPRAWQPRTTRLADGRVLVVGGLEDANLRPEGGGTSAPGVTTVEIFQ
jgi:hypothetical protein